MFKSAESLRLAAEMRALERVAAPWRQARTTWFDGTPDSIAARIAATDRVLTVARAGYTEAHVALEREAATARAQLVEARDRLLVDPIDDTARRTAGQPLVHPDISFNNTIRYPTDKDDNRFTLQQFRDVGPDETVEQRRQHPSVGIFNHDASEMLTNDGAHHWASRRTADETTGFGGLGPGYEHFGDDDFAEYDDYLRRHDYHTDHRALEHRLAPGFDDDDPARYSSRRTAGDGPGSPGDPTVDDLMPPIGGGHKPAGADWLAEMEPEDRPGYGEGGGYCRHCEEPIADKGTGYSHYDGLNAIGEPDYYDADHPAEPDEDY